MGSVQLARPRDDSCESESDSERESGCLLCLQNFSPPFSSPAKETKNTQVKARGKTEVTTQKRATGGAGADFAWCFFNGIVVLAKPVQSLVLVLCSTWKRNKGKKEEAIALSLFGF